MATAVASDLKAQMFIDGTWCDAQDGRTIAVVNPADESELAEVAYGGRADADRALEAARCCALCAALEQRFTK